MSKQLDELMRSEAYWDPKHANHARVVEDVRGLFQQEAAAAGELQEVGSVGEAFGRYQAEVLLDTPERRKVYGLMQGPAYFDERHPEHLLVKRQVRRFFGGEDMDG